MAVTNFSPLLGLALPTTGDLQGTWGTTVNTAITSLLDSAVAGTTTLSADADVTLSTTNGAANQARNAVLLWTASNGATTRYITAPAQSKAYLVINSGTGSIVVRGSGPTAGVTIPSGARALVAWNGSDFVKIVSNPVALTTDISGVLPVANGGTALTGGTSGGILAYTAAGVLASSAALAANKVVIGGGAGVVPASTNLLGTTAAVTSGNYIQALGYADTVNVLGSTGTALNIDITSAGVFTATLTGNCTFTLQYPVATGASSFILILTNDGTAGRTVAFSGGTFKYPGGSVTRTTTANATDIWFFFTPNAGTTYYASIPMANLS